MYEEVCFNALDGKEEWEDDQKGDEKASQ